MGGAGSKRSNSDVSAGSKESDFVEDDCAIFSELSPQQLSVARAVFCDKSGTSVASPSRDMSSRREDGAPLVLREEGGKINRPEWMPGNPGAPQRCEEGQGGLVETKNATSLPKRPSSLPPPDDSPGGGKRVHHFSSRNELHSQSGTEAHEGWKMESMELAHEAVEEFAGERAKSKRRHSGILPESDCFPGDIAFCSRQSSETNCENDVLRETESGPCLSRSHPMGVVPGGGQDFSCNKSLAQGRAGPSGVRLGVQAHLIRANHNAIQGRNREKESSFFIDKSPRRFRESVMRTNQWTGGFSSVDCIDQPAKKLKVRHFEEYESSEEGRIGQRVRGDICEDSQKFRRRRILEDEGDVNISFAVPYSRRGEDGKAEASSCRQAEAVKGVSQDIAQSNSGRERGLEKYTTELAGETLDPSVATGSAGFSFEPAFSDTPLRRAKPNEVQMTSGRACAANAMQYGSSTSAPSALQSRDITKDLLPTPCLANATPSPCAITSLALGSSNNQAAKMRIDTLSDIVPHLPKLPEFERSCNLAVACWQKYGKRSRVCGKLVRCICERLFESRAAHFESVEEQIYLDSIQLRCSCCGTENLHGVCNILRKREPTSSNSENFRCFFCKSLLADPRRLPTWGSAPCGLLDPVDEASVQFQMRSVASASILLHNDTTFRNAISQSESECMINSVAIDGLYARDVPLTNPYPRQLSVTLNPMNRELDGRHSRQGVEGEPDYQFVLSKRTREPPVLFRTSESHLHLNNLYPGRNVVQFDAILVGGRSHAIQMTIATPIPFQDYIRSIWENRYLAVHLSISLAQELLENATPDKSDNESTRMPSSRPVEGEGEYSVEKKGGWSLLRSIISYASLGIFGDKRQSSSGSTLGSRSSRSEDGDESRGEFLSELESSCSEASCTSNETYLVQETKEDACFSSPYLFLDLVEPGSGHRIQTPARAVSCRHVACFDLENHFRFNYSDTAPVPVWRCPICGSPAEPQDLYIDGWVNVVLQQSKHTRATRVFFCNKNLKSFHLCHMAQEKVMERPVPRLSCGV